jgi:hypothetical protein
MKTFSCHRYLGSRRAFLKEEILKVEISRVKERHWKSLRCQPFQVEPSPEATCGRVRRRFSGKRKQGDQGSMLRSQFSAIFANFRRQIGVFLKYQCYDQLFSKFSFVLSQKCQFFC